MSYAIRIEQVKPVPIAVVRRRARKSEFSRVVPDACGTVWNALQAVGIRGGRHVAVYRQAPGQFDLEIGTEIETAFAGAGEVLRSTLPGGEVATTVHFGPYNRLGDAHQAIRDWCTANHRAAIDPAWEIYGHWVDDWNKDPSKIRTDIFSLLKS